MIFHYFNLIELYRKVCDQFGNILYLKYVMYFTYFVINNTCMHTYLPIYP